MGARVHGGEVALGLAESGELAFLGIGIEAFGGEMPATMDAEVDDGVEPGGPAGERLLAQTVDS